VLPEAAWQRCYVLRNTLDHLSRKSVYDCLQELRWLCDRRDLAEAQKDLAHNETPGVQFLNTLHKTCTHLINWRNRRHKGRLKAKQTKMLNSENVRHGS
jgi:transposase-like protein